MTIMVGLLVADKQGKVYLGGVSVVVGITYWVAS